MIGVGGMAAAVNGFFRGRDEETQRQRTATDDKWRQQQRAVATMQQQHELAQQARADQLRTVLANVQTTRTVPGTAQDDGAGNIVNAQSQTRTVAVPKDQQLRQAAEAFKKFGDIARYLEASGQADAIMMTRSAQRASQLEAAAAGKTTMQIAEQARQIFDDDPYPQRIRSIKDDGAGGVIAEMEDTSTGQVMTQAFKTPAEIIMGFKSIYNPKAYDALQLARQQAAIKAQEEAGKPFTLKPGEKQFVRNAAGQMVEVAHNDPVGMINVGTEENPQWIKPGAGAPRAGAGKATDPVKAAQDAFEFIAKNGDAKLTPPQLAEGARLTQQIVRESEGKVPPELAAEVALQVSMDPAKAKPSIDALTGKIVTAYRHPSHGELLISRLPPDQVSEADMKRAMELMMVAQDQKVLPEMIRAASDQEARTRLEASVLGALEASYERRIAVEPQRADALRNEQAQAKLATRESLDRKLILIAKYGKPPAQQRPSGAGPSQRVPGYTPPPSSLAGMAVARRVAEQQAADAQKAEEAGARARTARNVTSEAQRLLQQDDGGEASQRALYGFQETPGFDLLDSKLKQEIHARVNRSALRP